MSVYDDIYNIIIAKPGDHRLWRQVHVAIMKVAGDIRAESAGTTNHANRLLWAASAETNPSAMVERLKGRVLQNAGLRSAPTTSEDSAVQAVVDGLVDDFATGE